MGHPTIEANMRDKKTHVIDWEDGTDLYSETKLLHCCYLLIN